MMRIRSTRKAPLAGLLLAAAMSISCSTGGSATSGSAPSYVGASENFRHFEDADALSDYLRYDSEAGPLISAHRGGFAPGYPENCLASMDRVLRVAPALLEVDVRTTADGVLILMHDEELGRATTSEGLVAERTLEQIRSSLLRDSHGIVTPFRVPTLAEALSWAEGRAILTLDVKPGLDPNVIVDAIRRHDASGRVVIIVYNLPDLMAFLRIAPNLNYSVPAETVEELQAALDSGMEPNRVILWTGVDEIRPELIQAAHARGIRTMLGTFGSIDDRARAAGSAVYESLLQAGIDVIATDRVGEAAKALEAVARYAAP